MGSCLILSRNYPRTETFVITSKESAIDMGEWNNYRYADTSGVPNSNSGTYSAVSRSASLDMGATNTYRYVNTSDVPNFNSSTYSATARSNSIDMGTTNSYRYINTSGVPSTYTSSDILNLGYSGGGRYAANANYGGNASASASWTATADAICCGIAYGGPTNNTKTCSVTTTGTWLSSAGDYTYNSNSRLYARIAYVPKGKTITASVSASGEAGNRTLAMIVGCVSST